MFGKSSLAKALEKWAKHGGDLRQQLSSSRDYAVKSKAEVTALCAALDALRAEPGRGEKDIISSPLHTLASFFQQVETQEAFDALSQDGLPRLRMWVRDSLDGRDVRVDDVMFIMKILAMYHQREDVDLIAEAARKPIDPDSFMWSIIFGAFDKEHPHAMSMIQALRDPLPTKFILVSYLDMSNGLAIGGVLDQHPFNSPAGRMQLDAWLRDTNQEHFSYAHSATAALPFVDASSRADLLNVAIAHPDPSVRMEAAWAQAKTGDLTGVERLLKYCLDPQHSHTARQYLDELGHTDKVPPEAQSAEFRAVAEMANWLAHPNEFGRSPDTIELYDSRELFWPPTNDRRQLFLVKYIYNKGQSKEPDRGIGMVGSVTFALFGEATADLSPEDVYALHCCWELEMNGDTRAPKKRSVEAGRQILKRNNSGF